MALLGASVYDRLQTFIYGDYAVAFNFFSRAFAHHGLKAGGSVVEIGCGTGLLGPKFIEAGFHYTGIDMEPARIAAARTLNPQGRFICGDLNDPSLLNQLDLTYCVMHAVIHHLSDAQFEALLNILRRNGSRMLCSMDPVRPKSFWDNPLGTLACDLDDGKHVRQLQEYRQLFPTDFQVESYRHKYPRWPADILYMAAGFL